MSCSPDVGFHNSRIVALEARLLACSCWNPPVHHSGAVSLQSFFDKFLKCNAMFVRSSDIYCIPWTDDLSESAAWRVRGVYCGGV